MKILVVNPPAFNNKDFIREGRCMQIKSSWAALWMPLSLCYISAVLRKKGHEIKLVDCIAEKVNNNTLITILKEFQPALVVLNTAIPSIAGDMSTAQLLKDTDPGIQIVIVGMFPTIFETEVLFQFKQIDYAIMDEPEWVIADLASALEENQRPDKIRGLIFRKDYEIIRNQKQNLSENDLDSLPFPARDLLNNDAYRLPTNNKKFTLLSVGRGCSGNCIFCIANVYYGRVFRKRSVESVISEIEECISKYDIRNFLFWGESFTSDPEYGEKICDELTERNIRITWSTTSRIDTLNPVLLEKMKKAGCILLGLGIESYDQEVLNNSRKGITVEQIDRAVLLTKTAGISTMGHFVFGLPGDTREKAEKSINFACKSLDFAQFYCAIPYPKTELAMIANEQKWLYDYNYSQFDLTMSVMRNEALSSEDIKKIRDFAYRKFYFRPKMIVRALREIKSVKSFFSILNFINWIRS